MLMRGVMLVAALFGAQYLYNQYQERKSPAAHAPPVVTEVFSRIESAAIGTAQMQEGVAASDTAAPVQTAKSAAAAQALPTQKPAQRDSKNFTYVTRADMDYLNKKLQDGTPPTRLPLPSGAVAEFKISLKIDSHCPRTRKPNYSATVVPRKPYMVVD